MGCADGETESVGEADGNHGCDFGGRPLSVGEVGFADLFTDGDDDALPADHGAEAESESDGDFDPGGDEFGRLVEELLVIAEDRSVSRGNLGSTSGLGKQGHRGAGEVHLVTDVGLHGRWNATERAVGGGLVANVVDFLLKSERNAGVVLLGAEEALQLSFAVADGSALVDVVV